MQQLYPVSRRRWALLAAAGVGVGLAVALYLRRCREHAATAGADTAAPTQQQTAARAASPHAVNVPFLGLVIEDSEFAQWTLTREASWHDYCEETDVAPIAVAEFVLANDVEHPQINVIAEDLIVSTTAAEYVEKSRQGMTSTALDTSCLKSVIDEVSGASDVNPLEPMLDACTFGFTECLESGVQRSVLSVVAVRYGVAVALQLVCRDHDAVRQAFMPVFLRVCRSVFRQLAAPTCELRIRAGINFIQFGLPSVRPEFPGVLMTLPAGRLQLLSHTHPSAQLIYDRLHKSSRGSRSGSHSPRSSHHHAQQHTHTAAHRQLPFSTSQHMVACVETRTHGGHTKVETYLVQIQSKSLFERAAQDHPLDASSAEQRPSAVRWRSDLLCFVVTIADKREDAEEVATKVADSLRPYYMHKRVIGYLHGPSGFSYAMPLPSDMPPLYVAQYFGLFDFQAMPSGTSSDRPFLRIAIREIRLETFASLQRAATRDYDERQVTKRPSAEGWCRLEVAVQGPRGEALIEYVTMLQHQGWFVHIVWVCPKHVAAGAALADDVRRSLHFSPL